MKLLKQSYNSNSAVSFVKKTALYATVITYVSLAFFSLNSCSSDDSTTPPEEVIVEVELDAPTLELISGTTDITQGVIGAPGFGSLQHSVKATAPEGFDQLVIYKVVDGIQSEYETIDTSNPDYTEGSNTYTYDLGYIFTEIDANKNVYFIAEIWDVENQILSLEFAEAEVKKPMQFVETVFMETRIPLDTNNMAIAQFLEINGETVAGVNLNKVVDEQINDKVAAILSYSEGEGIYLASPNSVVHQESVDDIDNKSETKFKKLNNEVLDLDLYNIFDTFTIEDLFNDAAFGGHEQRAPQINENDAYAIRTDDGRTALFKITYFEVINGDQVYLTMDMFVTQ